MFFPFLKVWMETSYTNEAAFILAMLLNKFYVLDDIKFCM